MKDTYMYKGSEVTWKQLIAMPGLVFPHGTDESRCREICGQTIGQAILKTLLDLKESGNFLVDSVCVLIMQPEADGTMKSVGLRLADGERGKAITDAVNKHFRLKESQ